MARLFDQYLAIYKNENSHNSITIIANTVQNFAQYQIGKPSKNDTQSVEILTKSGHTGRKKVLE